jgi:hypothetical protein
MFYCMCRETKIKWKPRKEMRERDRGREGEGEGKGERERERESENLGFMQPVSFFFFSATLGLEPRTLHH